MSLIWYFGWTSTSQALYKWLLYPNLASNQSFFIKRSALFPFLNMQHVPLLHLIPHSHHSSVNPTVLSVAASSQDPHASLDCRTLNFLVAEWFQARRPHGWTVMTDTDSKVPTAGCVSPGDYCISRGKSPNSNYKEASPRLEFFLLGSSANLSILKKKHCVKQPHSGLWHQWHWSLFFLWTCKLNMYLLRYWSTWSTG